MADVPQTLVFFHAHPDDEALLTAGTMAKATAAGHRVVLVTATSGEAGLADPDLQSAGLGAIREEELERSARLLGVQRLELLHYADSGLDGDRQPEDAAQTLCAAPVGEVADRVAAILAEESAETLVVYDAPGGYGHPDHRRVHVAGVLAAQVAGTRQVFAATAPREPFAWGARLADATLPVEFDPQQFITGFTPRHEITHKVNVRQFLDYKRAAMRAHTSQATGGDVRTLSAMLALPRSLYSLLLGTEFYARLQ